MCCSLLSQSQDTWGRRPGTKAEGVAGLQGGLPTLARPGLTAPGRAFTLHSLCCGSAQPTPVRCGGTTCLGAMGRAQIPEHPNPSTLGAVVGLGAAAGSL